MVSNLEFRLSGARAVSVQWARLIGEGGPGVGQQLLIAMSRAYCCCSSLWQLVLGGGAEPYTRPLPSPRAELPKELQNHKRTGEGEKPGGTRGQLPQFPYSGEAVLNSPFR